MVVLSDFFSTANDDVPNVVAREASSLLPEGFAYRADNDVLVLDYPKDRTIHFDFKGATVRFLHDGREVFSTSIFEDAERFEKVSLIPMRIECDPDSVFVREADISLSDAVIGSATCGKVRVYAQEPVTPFTFDAKLKCEGHEWSFHFVQDVNPLGDVFLFSTKNAFPLVISARVKADSSDIAFSFSLDGQRTSSSRRMLLATEMYLSAMRSGAQIGGIVLEPSSSSEEIGFRLNKQIDFWKRYIAVEDHLGKRMPLNRFSFADRNSFYAIDKMYCCLVLGCPVRAGGSAASFTVAEPVPAEIETGRQLAVSSEAQFDLEVFGRSYHFCGYKFVIGAQFIGQRRVGANYVIDVGPQMDGRSNLFEYYTNAGVTISPDKVNLNPNEIFPRAGSVEELLDSQQ